MKFQKEFYDSETLLRGILHNKPGIDYYREDENKATSAVFKDSKGISVNRTGCDKKYYDESLENLKNLQGHKFQKIGELNVSDCKILELYLKYCPTDDNEYHAEIHKSKNQTELTHKEYRNLAKNCKII